VDYADAVIFLAAEDIPADLEDYTYQARKPVFCRLFSLQEFEGLNMILYTSLK